MNIVIFGNAPLPFEGKYPVTAPGGRTWQILVTAADALARAMPQSVTLRLVALDDTPRHENVPNEIAIKCTEGRVFRATYLPLPYEKFILPEQSCAAAGMPLPDKIAGVIGCASAQPYSTAAAFAARCGAPLWIDVFGDPLAEIQTQAQTSDGDAKAAEVQQVHVWKLLLDALLQGDRFSTLSSRQRFALLGQLGCAGRLNRKTADESMVSSIPYGIVPQETAVAASFSQENLRTTVTLMWNGSFNTWMDVKTLTAGLTMAMRQEPRLRLMVVGGRVAGYSEGAYDEFVKNIQVAGLQGSVQLLDWQPFESMQQLYHLADIGLSIDRPSFEAATGSRTRIVHFMAAGIPVITTNLTELTAELNEHGLIATFDCGNSQQLCDAILRMAANLDQTRELGKKGQTYVYERFNAFEVGRSFARWVISPQFAPDKNPPSEPAEADTNELLSHWTKVRATLG